MDWLDGFLGIQHHGLDWDMLGFQGSALVRSGTLVWVARIFRNSEFACLVEFWFKGFKVGLGGRTIKGGWVKYCTLQFGFWVGLDFKASRLKI